MISRLQTELCFVKMFVVFHVVLKWTFFVLIFQWSCPDLCFFSVDLYWFGFVVVFLTISLCSFVPCLSSVSLFRPYLAMSAPCCLLCSHLYVSGAPPLVCVTLSDDLSHLDVLNQVRYLSVRYAWCSARVHTHTTRSWTIVQWTCLGTSLHKPLIKKGRQLWGRWKHIKLFYLISAIYLHHQNIPRESNKHLHTHQIVEIVQS